MPLGVGGGDGCNWLSVYSVSPVMTVMLEDCVTIAVKSSYFVQ